MIKDRKVLVGGNDAEEFGVRLTTCLKRAQTNQDSALLFVCVAALTESSR